MTSHHVKRKPHSAVDLLIVSADDVNREMQEFLCSKPTSDRNPAVIVRQSEAESCMLFYYSMQSRTLQQNEDNPLSLPVCQDTNLPWFPSAACTPASVTDSKNVHRSTAIV